MTEFKYYKEVTETFYILRNNFGLLVYTNYNYFGLKKENK